MVGIIRGAHQAEIGNGWGTLMFGLMKTFSSCEELGRLGEECSIFRYDLQFSVLVELSGRMT